MSGAPVKIKTVIGKEVVHVVERTSRVAWNAVVEAALKAAGAKAVNTVGWALKRKEGSSNAQRIFLHLHDAGNGGDHWNHSVPCWKD